MTERVDRAARHVAAPPARVFHALTDRATVERWLPPEGARGTIDAFEPRPGGAFRMTLTFAATDAGKSGPGTDVVDGVFLEVVADRLVRQRFTFRSDDPAFAGAMELTWSLTPAAGGTDVAVAAQGVPPGIGAAEHEAALASSLANLARAVEVRGNPRAIFGR